MSKTKSKEKKPSQSYFIREAIADGKEPDEIAEILDTKFGKGMQWAKSRYNMYTRAYGKKGKNDPKLPAFKEQK